MDLHLLAVVSGAGFEQIEGLSDYPTAGRLTYGGIIFVREKVFEGFSPDGVVFVVPSHLYARKAFAFWRVEKFRASDQVQKVVHPGALPLAVSSLFVVFSVYWHVLPPLISEGGGSSR